MLSRGRLSRGTPGVNRCLRHGSRCGVIESGLSLWVLAFFTKGSSTLPNKDLIVLGGGLAHRWARLNCPGTGKTSESLEDSLPRAANHSPLWLRFLALQIPHPQSVLFLHLLFPFQRPFFIHTLHHLSLRREPKRSCFVPPSLPLTVPVPSSIDPRSRGDTLRLMLA